MSNSAADGSGGTKPDPSQNNPWSAVENLLGFLLAGFGAVLSFLGLRSAEVTTVLRNYPNQASLIALLLLLGVLSAVLAVSIDRGHTKNVRWTIAVAIILVLFGLGSFVIYAIPVAGTPPILGAVLGFVLVPTGIILLVISTVAPAKKPAATRSTAISGQNTSAKTQAEDPRTISPIIIFILASVIFIAISTYGAMRLEATSQRSFDAQVVASVSMNTSGAIVSVHVTASKIKNNGYIGITVRGLPYAIILTAECKKVGSTPEHSATCLEDPCYWLPKVGDNCQIVMAGAIAPDNNGDVDETLNAPLSVREFQDIDVRAVICSETTRGCFSTSDSGSLVDIFLPKPQTSGS